jgi:hypothetical protein
VRLKLGSEAQPVVAEILAPAGVAYRYDKHAARHEMGAFPSLTALPITPPFLWGHATLVQPFGIPLAVVFVGPSKSPSACAHAGLVVKQGSHRLATRPYGKKKRWASKEPNRLACVPHKLADLTRSGHRL